MKRFFLLVITGVGVAILFWCFYILIQSRDAVDWAKTKGNVISSSLSIGHWPKFLDRSADPARWYGVQVQYEYSVGDNTYLSNRLSFLRWDTSNPKEALKTMNKYRRHHQVIVHYDPKDPKEAVIEIGDITDVFIPLMIGGLLTFLSLFALWNRSVEVNHKWEDSCIEHGYIYQNQGKVEEALSEYTKAIRLNPYVALGYSRRGNLYLQQKNWDQAIIDLKQALAINPKDGFSNFSLGNAYLGKEQYDQALIYMQKAAAAGFNVKPEILEDIKKKL